MGRVKNITHNVFRLCVCCVDLRLKNNKYKLILKLKTMFKNTKKSSNSTKPVLANRLFKFRAWVKEQNRMIKVFGFNEHLVFEQTWDSPSIKENIFEIEDCHIMQFTGLIDKNGTEIYEGDIIKRVIGFQGNENISFDLIGFHGAHFSATRFSPDLRTEGFLGNWTFHTMEVIGNYFENPELLQTTS